MRDENQYQLALDLPKIPPCSTPLLVVEPQEVGCVAQIYRLDHVRVIEEKRQVARHVRAILDLVSDF